MNINNFKNKIYKESKLYASKNGWQRDIFNYISKKLNLDYKKIHVFFPEGYVTLINMYLDEINEKMTNDSKKINLIRLRTRERIRELIILRLRIMQKEKKLISKTFFHLSLPNNHILSSTHLFKTADQIWYLAGDSSTDFNFYTKRLILSKIYTVTLFHFINNNNLEETIRVLDKQLEKVSKIPKIKRMVKDIKILTPKILNLSKRFSFIKQ